MSIQPPPSGGWEGTHPEERLGGEVHAVRPRVLAGALTKVVEQMTRTDLEPVVTHDMPPAPPSDRALSGFLRFGPIVLVLAVVAFGIFYWFDQRTPQVPTIVAQQIGRAETAVRENPNNVPARLMLAVLYHESGRLDDAITQLDEVLKVDGTNADARMERGRVLMDKGDLLGATSEFKQVAESFGDGEFAGADTRLQASHYWLGVIALQQDQPQQALDQIDRALVINPTDSDALFVKGQALARLGDHAAALENHRAALTFVPVDWCEPYEAMKGSFDALAQPDRAAWAAAMASTCGGDRAQVRTQLTALVDGPAGVDALLSLGQLAAQDNQKDAAVGWYRKALERDARNITAIGALAGLGVGPDGTPVETKK